MSTHNRADAKVKEASLGQRACTCARVCALSAVFSVCFGVGHAGFSHEGFTMIIFLMFEAWRFFWLILFIVSFRNSFQIIQADESEGKPPSLERWLIAPFHCRDFLQGASLHSRNLPQTGTFTTLHRVSGTWSGPEKPFVRAFNSVATG